MKSHTKWPISPFLPNLKSPEHFIQPAIKLLMYFYVHYTILEWQGTKETLFLSLRRTDLDLCIMSGDTLNLFRDHLFISFYGGLHYFPTTIATLFFASQKYSRSGKDVVSTNHTITTIGT